jgi:hypothetical protein
MLEPALVHYDNQSCIKFFENSMFHDRSKHIDIQYHFLRNSVQKGAVVLKYVPSNSQVVDILAKPLAKGEFEMLRETLGLVKNTFLTKRER